MLDAIGAVQADRATALNEAYIGIMALTAEAAQSLTKGANDHDALYDCKDQIVALDEALNEFANECELAIEQTGTSGFGATAETRAALAFAVLSPGAVEFKHLGYIAKLIAKGAEGELEPLLQFAEGLNLASGPHKATLEPILAKALGDEWGRVQKGVKW